MQSKLICSIFVQSNLVTYTNFDHEDCKCSVMHRIHRFKVKENVTGEGKKMKTEARAMHNDNCIPLNRYF